MVCDKKGYMLPQERGVQMCQCNSSSSGGGGGENDLFHGRVTC